VVVFDFPGFGLSAKPARYSYSLLEQAEYAIGVWRALGHTRGHLLAHDYGTSVATELLARRRRDLLPIELHSVTLFNGSVHIELAQLRLSQKILRNQTLGPILGRLASARFFKARMRSIVARPEALDDEELDAMWEALVFADGRERISPVTQYLRERERFWQRWIGALEDLDLPAHVVWGRRDPVAVPQIAVQLEREIPRCTLTWLDDLGHYPHVEAPDRFADAVLRWLDDHP
jgi:pimeloyl-ACP methyl ester carboxylesterase